MLNQSTVQQRVKSRRDHATTTTTGGIGVLDTGDGGSLGNFVFDILA